MKFVPAIVLLGAAAALAVVALRAPERTYVAPTVAEVQAHAPAPRTIPVATPPGCAIRTFDVAGMCCNGCTGKIHARLAAAPGVVAAAVDFEAGTAQALVPSDADVAALAGVLSFDKYSATPRP